jgi:hypothetical protein
MSGQRQQALTRQQLEEMLLAKYPSLRVTSRDRSPQHNAAVGGASGSRHLHGDAIDVGMRELPDDQRREVANYARSIGAKGFGYYPNSNSMHFDLRPSGEAFWGPNYSRTSLNQTPGWFQTMAGQKGPGADLSTTAGITNQAPVAIGDLSTVAPAATEVPAMTPMAPAPVQDDGFLGSLMAGLTGAGGGGGGGGSIGGTEDPGNVDGAAYGNALSAMSDRAFASRGPFDNLKPLGLTDEQLALQAMPRTAFGTQLPTMGQSNLQKLLAGL